MGGAVENALLVAAVVAVFGAGDAESGLGCFLHTPFVSSAVFSPNRNRRRAHYP